MTNAYGYAARQRHENRLDPNRDFPYLQGAANCMKTQTARAVNDTRRQRLAVSYIALAHNEVTVVTAAAKTKAS